MTYYFFLKSLRRLEEFRKNPHVKIPPNFPCVNFQSLDKFQNSISNSKIFLLHFRPGHPYQPTRPLAQPTHGGISSPAGRSPQAGPSRLAHAHRWRNCRSMLSPLIHAFRSRRLLSTHRWHKGPACQSRLLHRAGRLGRESSAPLMPSSLYCPPHHFPP
jgi:hypothetical protein